MSAVLDNSAIQAVFHQPRPDGAYEGAMLDYLRRSGARRPILLLAFAPKVAGTFFRQAAIFAINGRLIRVVHAQGGRDGTLYLPNVLACCLDTDIPNFVTHVHMQALTANRHFIEALELKPIVMIRNLPDTLASYWDMLDSDPVARAEGLNCLITDNFLQLSRAEKADFLIDIIAPWYASYYATWKIFADEAPDRVCVLHYGEFRADTPGTLRTALAHGGFAVSRAHCEAALARAWESRDQLRFNSGTQGRSKDYFSAHHLEKLARMLSYYPQLGSWTAELLG